MSQRFFMIPEDQIIDFMEENDFQKEDCSLLDSIESVSDLWTLANIKITYDKENN